MGIAMCDGRVRAGMLGVLLLVSTGCADKVRDEDAKPPASASADSAERLATVSADSGAATAAATADSNGVAVIAPAAGSDSVAPAPPTEGRIIPVATPDKLHGLYLNAWAAGSTKKLGKLIDIAKRTEVNAFVIDVKEGGEISYDSKIPLANQINADKPYIRNPRLLLQKLKDAGIYPIARIVVFKDKTLANAKPEWAIIRADKSLWKDRDGNIWVDSFNKAVWDYNIAIAREAIEMGFAEVQWDYVRFPDTPPSLMASAIFPARKDRTKANAIREFLQYSKAQLAQYKVPITADVFGLTVSVQNDLGIGQQWEKMSDVTDVLLPMVYPSHFARGSYGIPVPNAAPYTTVKKAMDYAVKRSKPIANAAEVRPWLQDFTLGAPRYGAAQVRAQIKATYDAGLTDWVLWNPGSNYTEAALAKKDGTPPDIALPAENAATSKAKAPVVSKPRPDSISKPDSTRRIPVKPDTTTASSH